MFLLLDVFVLLYINLTKLALCSPNQIIISDSLMQTFSRELYLMSLGSAYYCIVHSDVKRFNKMCLVCAFYPLLFCVQAYAWKSLCLPSFCRILAVCGMHPDHQETLKKNRVVLAKQLLLSELLEHLLEKDIITLEMRELIQVSGWGRLQEDKLVWGRLGEGCAEEEECPCPAWEFDRKPCLCILTL